MSAKRPGAGEARWRALIGEQERSGEGVARFAERRGLCAATMYWWRSRLRRRHHAAVKLAAVWPGMSSDPSAGMKRDPPWRSGS